MALHLDWYRRIIKPLLKATRDRKPDLPLQDLINLVANNTSCHLIAVCYYYQELYGVDDEILKMTKRLEEWYNIGEVLEKLSDEEI